MTDLDPDDLDPGIRHTVLWLRRLGFETTDSGDGVSKGADGLDEPHVHLACAPSKLVKEARRLHAECTRAGLCVEPVGTSKIYIQADYDPANDVATISLFGVDDKALSACTVSV